MAYDKSALDQIKQFERQVNGQFAALDVDIIGRETARTITLIKRLLADARLDIRDYEMSDSRAAMDKNAKAARKRLEQLRGNILVASEHGIFNVIDVAQLSVQLDALVDALLD